MHRLGAMRGSVQAARREFGQRYRGIIASQVDRQTDFSIIQVTKRTNCLSVQPSVPGTPGACALIPCDHKTTDKLGVFPQRRAAYPSYSAGEDFAIVGSFWWHKRFWLRPFHVGTTSRAIGPGKDLAIGVRSAQTAEVFHLSEKPTAGPPISTAKIGRRGLTDFGSCWQNRGGRYRPTSKRRQSRLKGLQAQPLYLQGTFGQPKKGC